MLLVNNYGNTSQEIAFSGLLLSVQYRLADFEPVRHVPRPAPRRLLALEIHPVRHRLLYPHEGLF